MTDPWAAAAAGTTTAPATTQNGESQLAQDYSGEESQLFGGESKAPSLFNKTHQLGAVRTGIITRAPYDVHSTTFGENAQPKYWTPDWKVTTDAVGPGGVANKPIKDTLVELQTDYRMDAAERTAIGRAEDYEDEGARIFYAGGQALKALREAIKAAGKNGIRITSGEAMVGLRLTVKRSGQKPNPGGNPSWLYEAKIERA